MVQPKVRGLEIEAVRQANERDRTSADQVNPGKSGTSAPCRDAERQTVSPDLAGDGDDAGSLAKVLGVANPEFVQGLLGQLLQVSARGRDKFDTADMHFTFGLIEGKKPTDELEMMQLTQMSAIHTALMKASGDLARAETVFEREYLTRAVNQLARTHTAQLEAFNRYRSGIEQKVTVQNVSVAEGGQAIVGNVTQAAAATEGQTLSKAAPALTYDRKPAMEILGDARRDPGTVSAKNKREAYKKRTSKDGAGSMDRGDGEDE
jgi:hypothetical protein